MNTENFKQIGVAAALLLIAIVGGDAYLAFFGAQSLNIIIAEYAGPGMLTTLDVFTVITVINLFLAGVIANQWAASSSGYTFNVAETSASLIQRAAAVVLTKLFIGPLIFGLAHVVVRLRPAAELFEGCC